VKKISYNQLNPSVPKRYLTLIAALTWTLAAVILLSKAITFLNYEEKYLIFYSLLSLTGGLLFYYFLFSKIATKHIKRLTEFRKERYCVFSFFSIRSYLLMILMITLGIVLRKSALIEVGHLAFLYLMMGVPLLLSAFRFYHEWITGFRK
jgi:hypothetical protein